ncbi:MAG: hypothetical protein AB7I25_04740 [Vicinamibacterales bacterium]
MTARTHYLQTPQIAVIFLSFLLLAVPLAFVQLSPDVPRDMGRWITLAYAVVFGNTHFAITWALYLNAANLRHFRSTPGRAAIYFAGPPAILLTFWYLGVRQAPAPGTTVFVWFVLALTAADYFHVVRQSFGVYEMFRTRTGARFPSWAPSVDNAYFLALWALQLLTFGRGVVHGFAGAFDPSDPLTRIGLAAAAVLLVFMLRSLAAAWQTGADRTAVLVALAYLVLQSASALMVVYRSQLYVASLAMHYVEYHVLMAPRIFNVPLDASSRVDRVAAWFRRHRTAFYLGLLLVAAWASSAAIFGMSGLTVRPDGSFGWYLVNMLSGIFLAHYFIEAFVWKFGNPFYRQTLGPIYFAAPASAGTGARPGRRNAAG